MKAFRKVINFTWRPQWEPVSNFFFSFHCSLWILCRLPPEFLVFTLFPCVRFSFCFLIALIRPSSCFPPARVSAPSSLFNHPVPVCLSICHLFVCLSAYIPSVAPLCSSSCFFFLRCFICSVFRLLAYAVSPSLCQCFSSCQSFSLSVSPFVPFSLSLTSSPMYAYVCVHVCVRIMSMLELSVLVCWLSAGSTCAMTGCVIHRAPSARGVKYFSQMKNISVLRSLLTLITDIGKKLPTGQWKHLQYLNTNEFTLWSTAFLLTVGVEDECVLTFNPF